MELINKGSRSAMGLRTTNKLNINLKVNQVVLSALM